MLINVHRTLNHRGRNNIDILYSRYILIVGTYTYVVIVIKNFIILKALLYLPIVKSDIYGLYK